MIILFLMYVYLTGIYEILNINMYAYYVLATIEYVGFAYACFQYCNNL